MATGMNHLAHDPHHRYPGRPARAPAARVLMQETAVTSLLTGHSNPDDGAAGQDGRVTDVE